MSRATETVAFDFGQVYVALSRITSLRGLCGITSRTTETVTNPPARHVIIVGAGMAGLTCARALLEQCVPGSIQITVLEASDRAGGRIRRDTDFVLNRNLDLGAEYIHGSGHVLWDQWMKMTQQQSNDDDDHSLEPYFILSHADGGPGKEPTAEGKYGMFYYNGALIMYNDPKVAPLQEALDEVLDPERILGNTNEAEARHTSIQDVMPDHVQHLYGLALAGFGNTAGCSDLSKLSLSQLALFEEYWETNEEEGDYRPRSGMYSIVQSTLDTLEQYDNFQLILNAPVNEIIIQNHQHSSEDQNDNANQPTKQVVSCRYSVDGNERSENDCTTLTPYALVVTVPPHLWPTLFPTKDSLPPAKQRAISYIGMERAVKVMCKFTRRFWPEAVQSIISADTDQPIPEMWFQSFPSENVHIAVGFLVSSFADRFVEAICSDGNDSEKSKQQREERATKLMVQQMAAMFRDAVSLEELHAAHVKTMVYDWKSDHPYIQGGYMYPKVGISPTDFQALAEPIGNVYFAGEATNTNACCTVQAAMETGLRAAKQIVQNGKLELREPQSS